MKWYNKFCIAIIVCGLFYVIGNIAPISAFNFSIRSEPVKTSEFLQLIVAMVSAFVTFLAVIIALFKEDIRKIWEFSKIEISLPEENFFEILNTSVGSSADAENQPLEAIKYNCKIEVINSGSISATDLEISCESLLFKGQEYPTSQSIETKTVHWSSSNETKIALPPEGKKIITILELSSPTQQSSPEGNNKDIPPLLNIAGTDISPDFKNGKWIGSFAIFSTNSKPMRFKLEIDWNGQWQKRATEMKRHLKIDLKN